MDSPSGAGGEQLIGISRSTVTAGRAAGGAAATGSGGHLALVAWLLAILGVVGAAVGGRLIEPGQTGDHTAAIALGPASGSTPAAPTASRVPAPEVIVLTRPAQPGMTITTRELEILGYLLPGTASVRVTLEARGNRIIDDATITPVRTTGDGPTLDRRPQFSVRFGLPNPRPNGRMIVQVAAYDRDGRMLDVVRRPFRVGPLLEDAAG